MPSTKLIKIQEGPKAGQQVSVMKDMGHMSLSSMDVPEIESWEVGEDYKVEVTIRQKSKRLPDFWEIEEGVDPNTIKADFDIIGVKAMGATKTPTDVSEGSNDDTIHLD